MRQTSPHSKNYWALSNAILFMVPLAFGIRFGLLCLVPVAVSEIVWFCILLKAGPLLHLFSFAVTIIVLGLAGEKLKRSPTPQRVTGSCILYELSLPGEETLYYGLRMLFLNRPFTWADVSGSFLSWANPLMLLLLVYCIVKNGVRQEKDKGHRCLRTHFSGTPVPGFFRFLRKSGLHFFALLGYHIKGLQ